MINRMTIKELRAAIYFCRVVLVWVQLTDIGGAYFQISKAEARRVARVHAKTEATIRAELKPSALFPNVRDLVIG